MSKKKILYTKEQCKEIFSKCKNRTEFKEKYYGAYCRCKENGWLKEICPSLSVSKAENICVKCIHSRKKIILFR